MASCMRYIIVFIGLTIGSSASAFVTYDFGGNPSEPDMTYIQANIYNDSNGTLSDTNVLGITWSVDTVFLRVYMQTTLSGTDIIELGKLVSDSVSPDTMGKLFIGDTDNQARITNLEIVQSNHTDTLLLHESRLDSLASDTSLLSDMVEILFNLTDINNDMIGTNVLILKDHTDTLLKIDSTFTDIYDSIVATNFVSKVSFHTASFTVGDSEAYYVDCSGGTVTVTMPGVSGKLGRFYRITKTDTYTDFPVVVDPNGTEQINDTLTLRITQRHSSANIISDGTMWRIQ